MHGVVSLDDRRERRARVRARVEEAWIRTWGPALSA